MRSGVSLPLHISSYSVERLTLSAAAAAVVFSNNCGLAAEPDDARAKPAGGHDRRRTVVDDVAVRASVPTRRPR